MLSYSFIFELVEEKYKNFCVTFINIVDVSTFSFIGLYLQYVDRDAISFMEWTYVIQTSLVMLAIVILPESPHWLFLKG